MIIISEVKLDTKQIESYEDRGIRFAYGYEDFKIGRTEAVGFILDTLYKSTMDLINDLLYWHHNIILKYHGDTYKLNTLEEWKHSYQSDKDMLKTTVKYHPIYQIYLDKRREYFEAEKLKEERIKYGEIAEYLKSIPSDEELDSFVKTFSYLYQLDVDMTSKTDKLKAYAQINYYLEHDIEYVNEPQSISPDDEPMFKFEYQETETPIEVTSFGDETYLEDYVYKNI